MNDHNRQTLFMALLTGAALVAWVLIASLLVPLFIQHAHQGTLPSVFSDLMPRRTLLPLEHYLGRVQRIGVIVFVLLALGGLALIAATRPSVQRHLNRRLPTSKHALPEHAHCLPLSRRRQLAVSAVIGVVVGGHLFDIVTGTEHWPFSHYGMFSALARKHISARLSLYGVTKAGDVPLNVPGYFAPLDDQRIRGTIRKLLRRSDAHLTVEHALRDSGARYERLRLMGAHDGPRLLAIKLVEASWTQDEWAANKESPDSIRVLYEVRVTDGED